MYETTRADRVSTEAVAEWIAQYDVTRAPAGAGDNVNLVLLDTLGVIVGATRHEVGKNIVCGAIALGAGGDVVVPGSSARVDLAAGALLYGTLGHGIELDEVHLPSRQHVGAATVAAALALGQRLNSPLDQLREALLIGYEIAGHLGVAMDNNILLDRNFHMSGIVSAFGGTAVAARMLKLTPAQVYHALGLTASQACGTLAWHTESHHMSKSLQCGLAARNGVTAALLAQQGCPGPDAVFAGPYNYFKAFRGSEPDAEWYRGLGKAFEILNASMKLYAAGRPMHAALDALLELMKQHALGAADIASMDVHMPPGAARIVDGNATNAIDCKTVMATAALEGKYGLDESSDTRAARADVQALKQRIRVVHDGALDIHFPRHFPALIRMHCHDGRVCEQTVVAATGERDRPMTADAIREKFRGLASPVLGDGMANRVADMVYAKGKVTAGELAGLLAKSIS